MAEVKVRASDLRRKGKPAQNTKKTGSSTRAHRQPRPPQRPVEPAESELVDDDDEEEDVQQTQIQTTGSNVPDITKWPTRAEAARKVGVNKSTIIRWQKDGELEAVLDGNGFYRFNPEDLEMLASNRSNEAAVMMGQSVSMVVQSSTDLAGKAQQHAQAFADSHLKQSDIAFEQMRLMTVEIREENHSLREYIRNLENDRKEAVKEVEAAKGKVHERQLAEMELTKRENRIDWAVGTFIQLAGPGIARKMGLPVGAIPPLPGMPAMPGAPTQSLPSGGAGITPPSVEGAKTQEVNGTGALQISNPPTVQDLINLETNTLLLIGNIEEDRIKMVCQFSKPNEAEALMQIWTTVNKMKAAATEAAAKQGTT